MTPPVRGGVRSESMGRPASAFLRGVSVACVLACSVGLARRTLADRARDDLVVLTSRATGLATLVTSGDGGAIPLALPVGGPGDKLTGFLNQHGHLFGVSNPSNELAKIKSELCLLGQTHTTYQQRYSGVRVFGAVLKVHQDSDKDVIAANGHFFEIPKWLNPTPTLSPDAAEAIAQAQIGDGEHAIERSELVIVDPSWYGDPPIGTHLAYHVIVSDRPALIREAFFVDAHTGRVLDRWTLIETVLDRKVYFGQNIQQLRAMEARFEGEPRTWNSDADRAYDYGRDFYDFLLRMFDRDGILLDIDFTMYSTVHYGTLPPLGGTFCPNAFWDGTDTAFCTGTAQDDVVAHEWGHALTGATAGLMYQNQPGQLNESYSDIWGELTDLFNGNAGFPGPPQGPDWPVPIDYIGPGTDTPNNKRAAGLCSYYDWNYVNGVRWLLGEDSTGPNGFHGALRDMWEPTCYGNPDRAYHEYQTCYGPDNGGVHSGSGIPNHAFAILTDGKEFNGYTVTGIGPIKAAAVWYRALLYYLTPVSDFEDAYAILKRSASDLIGTIPKDPRTGGPSPTEFTAADALQVDLALRAVQMDAPGACGSSPDVLSRHPVTQCSPRMIAFDDDFEDGAGDWTVENTSPPTPYDWVLVGDLPFDRQGTAWFVDDPREGTGDEAARHSLMSPPILIPVGINEQHRPKLAFTHFVATDYIGDGGNVRISVNGGAWELIESQAFEFNPYNETIQGMIIAGNNNPLEGQTAWTGVAMSWATSVADLSSLVQGGDTIRIRFDFGKDAALGYEGWFIDDFAVYVCSCDEDAFCDDGIYCNGAEFCLDGFCKKGSEPCDDEYCDELAVACVPAIFWDDFGNGNVQGWELLSEDNTAGENGWWVIGNPIGTNLQGIRVQPENPYAGLGCAYTGRNPDGQFYNGDVDDGITYMISPTIDLSGHSTAELSYARWFYEHDRNDGHDDFFAVDISGDNGANWVNLETVRMTDSDPLSFLWMPRSFQLEDFIDLTRTFKLRFAAQAGPGTPDDTVEAAVDEVLITSSESCSPAHGDADRNCRVNLADYRGWTDCMTGPDAGPPVDECSVFDSDSDLDVDVRDFAEFLLIFSGD